MLSAKTQVVAATDELVISAIAGTEAISMQMIAHADELIVVTVPSRPSSPSCRLLLFTMNIVSRLITGI